MLLKRRKIMISEEVKLFRKWPKNQALSQNEIVKGSVLPPLSLSNVILWKASIVEEESCCGPHSEKWGCELKVYQMKNLKPYYCSGSNI
jgi:hypothetical protein